ncbi:MAG: chromosomal replication initiator protein DnaA, partial [Alphaproteobacteria bacterium]|nr:chromosomal replication initiator protein DnaA [Alphaproteobacteria bacterium]
MSSSFVSPSSVSASPAWDAVKVKVREQFGETIFKRWLEPLVCKAWGADVHLTLPTRFMKDWVDTHYTDKLKTLFQEVDANVKEVMVTVESVLTSPETSRPAAAANVHPIRTTSSDDNKMSRPAISHIGLSGNNSEREDISSPLDPRFTFESFVVGKPNELAYAAARRVAEASQVSFNPLFLYGGVGLGKTHLMHAIAWHIRKCNPARRVMYLSAEKFMYQFVRALRFKDTMAFKEQFRSIDVLMIDDIQFISGKDSTQEEFFHTFNTLVDQNRQVIVSADKSPHDLEKIEERLRSRLGWGLCADLHPTSYELRLGILHTKAEAMKCAVPEKVLEFLGHRITSNVRELEGALNRIIAHSQLIGRPITLETTQELLQDLLRATSRRVTIEEIQKKVAEHYNVKLADMHSPRRARAVARPR